MKTRLAGAVAAALLGAVTPAGAAPTTQQLSPGAATDAAISQDGRIARYAAYVEVRGGTRQVRLVKRAEPAGNAGTPWRAGRTVTASTDGGKAGNGDSYAPVFGGYDDTHGIHAAKCMAFITEATNLDGGSHSPHVVVRSLGSGKLTRVKGSDGATEVALDGECEDLAFVAGGTVYKAGTDGRGKTRISKPGGAASPNLSASGKVVTFERKGVIYTREGGDTRRIAAGAQPDADDFSKVVAFVKDGVIHQANLTGGPAAHALDQRGGGTARGSQPSESQGGGGFVFYATGAQIRVNAVTALIGDCGRAAARAPMTSSHGNYLVFTCAGGGAFLTYVGAQ
jgi:hypothetical protein